MALRIPSNTNNPVGTAQIKPALQVGATPVTTTEFPKDSFIAVPTEDEGYVPAMVQTTFTAGETATVRILTNDPTEKRFLVLEPAQSKNALRIAEQESNASFPDLSRLMELNNATILLNLKRRFEKNQIYTNVGPILISINPYKGLGLYNEKIRDAYLGLNPNLKKRSRRLSRAITSSASNVFDLIAAEKEQVEEAKKIDPTLPHLFGLAEESFRGVMDDHKDQSCIMSGESGAGKTEATKIFLQYLAAASSNADSNALHASRIQERITRANPLLEAFGNAKTTRNNNSSRFGNWICVKVNDSCGAIVGCVVTNYLLEKSRLISQAKGERNYHILYQLVTHSSNASKLDFPNRPENYHFLNRSGTFTAHGRNDSHDFEFTKKTMSTMGISEIEQNELFTTLAGVLHLGNVVFKAQDHKVTGDKCAVIEDEAPLVRAAEQLGITLETLKHVLTSKNMSNSVEDIWKPFTVEQAVGARNALAKAIYGNIFDWVIARVNDGMKETPEEHRDYKSTKTIGVLDTFGFEIFESNSFEQLCINYCNEKMQYYFNERIFRLEQNLYKDEGIFVPDDVVRFANNEPCLALLDKDISPTVCVFTLIDDEIRIPQGSDLGYLKRVRKMHSDHPSFIPHASERKMGADSHLLFGVKHYAGEVYYNVTGFLSKNQDSFPVDLEKACSASSSQFLQTLFPRFLKANHEAAAAASTASDEHSSKRGQRQRGTALESATQNKKTLGTQFKEQLSQLMKIISSTETHFVRCIKPNDVLQADNFNGGLVLKQLRYAGVLEACRIRKNGYPVRMSHSDFYRFYRSLAPKVGNANELVQAVLSHPMIKLPNNETKAVAAELKGMSQIVSGRTLVFMSSETHTQLEIVRLTVVAKVATKVAAIVRGRLLRIRARVWRDTLKRLDEAVETLDEATIDRILSELEEKLPCEGGSHLALVKKAAQISGQLKEEQVLYSQLEFALELRDASCIEAALRAATNVKHDLSGKLKRKTHQAKVTLKQLSRAIEIRRNIREAIQSRDIHQLSIAIADAEKSAKSDGLDLFLSEFERQNINDRDYKTNTNTSSKEQQGTESEGNAVYVQKAARRFAVKIRYQWALEQLRTAMGKNDSNLLDEALKGLANTGIIHPLVLEAREMRKKIGEELKASEKFIQNQTRLIRYKCLKYPDQIKNSDIVTFTKYVEDAKVAGVNELDLETASAALSKARSLFESKQKKSKFGWISKSVSSCLPVSRNSQFSDHIDPEDITDEELNELEQNRSNKKRSLTNSWNQRLNNLRELSAKKLSTV